MNTYTFSIVIDCPVQKVYPLLMDQSQYHKWSSSWGSVQQMIGTWEVGGYVSFIDSEQRGTKVLIEEMVPNRHILTKHIAMVDGINQELEPTDDVMKAWIGTREDYFFESSGEQTTLTITMVMDEAFSSMAQEGWPKALQQFKEMCES